jgi:GntR family transcriptional regulator / MocR family aminotransferase
MRTRLPSTVSLVVDREQTAPLAEQIARQLGAAVEAGALPRGGRMPSTRGLAGLLGVSRGVALDAYERLCRRGYAEARPGSGTFVTRPRSASPARIPIDMRPGRTDLEGFPLAQWRAAWRWASHRPPLSAPPALGLPVLRRAVAAFLSRTRAVALAEHDVAVTAGPEAALRLAVGAVGGAVAVQRPAPPGLWRAVGRTGLTIPVDRCGAVPDGVPAPARTAVVSPVGSGRGADWSAWAARTGGRVIEVGAGAIADPPPVGAILVGGFDHLLTPAVRIGYATLPGPPPTGIAGRPPLVAQLALARLLDGGVLDRIAQRLATRCERGWPVLSAAVARPLRLIAPGTALLDLPGRDPEAVAAGLRAHGLLVDTTRGYVAGPAPPGLVLGYGHLSEARLRRAAARLSEALRPASA